MALSGAGWLRWSALCAMLGLTAFGVGLSLALALTSDVIRSRYQPDSLTELILYHPRVDAMPHIMNGYDINERVRLRTELDHWRKGEIITPLVAATLTDRRQLIEQLIRYGAKLREAPNDRLLCIVASSGSGSLGNFLMRQGAVAVPQGGCDDARSLPEEVARKAANTELSDRLRIYRHATANNSGGLP